MQQHVREQINETLTWKKEQQEEQLLVSLSRADETGTTVLPAHLVFTSSKDC